MSTKELDAEKAQFIQQHFAEIKELFSGENARVTEKRLAEFEPARGERLFGKRAAEKQYADAHLTELKTDAVNWTVEYVCPETKRRFLLDYPQSELHGGGPPRLTPMDG